MKLLFMGAFLISAAPISALEFKAQQIILEEHTIPAGYLPKSYEVHASSITQAHDGSLIATWFGGTKENHQDVSIWVSTKKQGGKWSEPLSVDDGRRKDGKLYSCWNPVLITHPDSTIYLYYKISGPNSDIKKGYRNWWGAVRTSRNHGETWSSRQWLPQVKHPSGVFDNYSGYACGPVKNRPIILGDGSLLCGASTETEKGWRIHFEKYQANDWTGEKHGVKIIGPLMKGKKGIQPTFLKHHWNARKLQVLFRDQGVSWSEDFGSSWSFPRYSNLKTSKGLHAVSTKSGWHFLAYNPKGRTPLSLARSRDGKTWEVIVPVLAAEGDKRMDYPTIIQSEDDNLHITYSHGRSSIKHLVLDIKLLTKD